MFGSTIEYVLKNYTKELPSVEGKILPDGSMHSFKKEGHLNTSDRILDALKEKRSFDVATPTYPLKNMHLPDILSAYKGLLSLDDKNILIYADGLRFAELNMLFQYHKISVGMNKGLDIFCDSNSKNIINWNSNYTHWSQMQSWELREWLSLFYPTYVQEWIESQHQVDDTFLKISTRELLETPLESFQSIIDFCALTKDGELDDFANTWAEAQSYVVREFDLLDQIVENSILEKSFEWDPINIVAESIVQQRLRQKGFEMMCNDLNIFPTDAKSLYNLLYRV